MPELPEDEVVGSRLTCEPELIVFHGHKAECRYCEGVVKMARDPDTLVLLPDRCHCLLCAQRYFVQVEGKLEDYDAKQWEEKFAARDSRRNGA